MSLQQLSSATIKLITSSQVITSVSSVVKELMENAIDAGATYINVKIEDNGLGKIEVQDDGRGIQKSDMKNVCLPSYTSKISDFCDLESLQSYGFRGEALSALCQISDVVITTRTADDELAAAYTIGNNGEVKETKLSHHGIGTQITATHLFKNLPVRKQYLNTGRRAADELKRTECVVKALAVIHSSLRVTLSHNKCSLWRKTGVASLRLSLMQVIGHTISNQLEELSVNDAEVTINLLVPKKDCSNIVTQSSAESIMVFVNKRPVKYKKLEQMIMKYMSENFEGQIPTRKYPNCLASINVSPGYLDVNLEPNKTRVLFKNEEEVLCIVEKLLLSYYMPRIEREAPKVVDTAPSPIKHTLSEENGETSQVSKKPKFSTNEKTELAEDVMSGNDTTESTMRRTFYEGQASNEEVGTGCQIDKNGLLEGTQDTKGSKENGNASWDDSFFDLESGLIPLCADQRSRSYMQYTSHPETSVQSEGKMTSLGEEPKGTNVSYSLPSSNEKEPCISDEMWAEIDRAAGWTDAQLAIVNGDASISNSSKRNNETVHAKPKTARASPVQSFCNTITSKLWEKDKSPSIAQDKENELGTKENNRKYSKQGSLSKYISPKSEGIRDEVDNAQFSLDLDCVDLENQGHDFNEKPIVVTKEKWSTGNVRTGNGKLVQGSCVLLPNAAGSSSPNQMDQSVSSQMGQKENSAFTKFSREIRPQILQDHPGIAFTKVASLMVSRWRSLKGEERERYENKAREYDEERKRQYYSSTEFAPLDPEKKKERIEKFQQLLNNSIEARPKKKETNAGKKKVSRPGRKEHFIDISFETIAKKVIEGRQYDEMDFRLVGQLESGVWLYRQETEIGIVRHWGLHETVLCDQLMKDHTVPLKRLDDEILLNKELMGSDHWKLMLSLDRSCNGFSQHITINSPFVSKNGFRIEVNEGVVETTCALTGIPSVSRFYGVAELKEMLLLLEKYGPQASLDQCRPIKICYYLEAEAVRMARESSALDREAMHEILKYWHTTLDRECYTCLHNQPIFIPIHQLGATTLANEDLW